jgi:nitrate/TMAO reductase-like tetraheme cytochrome c subunit
MTTTPTGDDAGTTAVDPEAPEVLTHRRPSRLLAPARWAMRHAPRSGRGLLLLIFIVGGFGSAVAVGGVMTVKYTESASFCGKCHTMDPELKAHAASAHKELTCAECHVAPGVTGWVKAKVKGTRQLIDLATHRYPTPVPPPDHATLPSVKDTCLKCHSLDNITADGGPMKLVMRPRFASDEKNTRQMVAVLIRPGSLGQERGVHWHIQKKVTYTASDERSSKIGLVEIARADGSVEQFIAGRQVNVSTDVDPDIARLKSKQISRTMDCLDCHNRIGHEVPTPEQAVDDAIASGQIDSSLPFIKREGTALLSKNYSSEAAAEAAIAGLRATYASRYPLVLRSHDAQVTAAVDQLQSIYRLVATPAMKVQARTYPDNLGHQSSPGCFRCHDGAHYKVVKGKLTTQTIPSTCGTCHTFPQIGATVADVPIGSKPADHRNKLFVFDHKNSVSSTNPSGTSCGACHQKSYCENCHNSGAIKVKHTTMLYNHASAAAAAGGTQACATCHQPAYCAGCHKDPVLPSGDLVLPPGTVASRTTGRRSRRRTPSRP